ncbi:MAG TPA: glucose-1-phosphate thymidylyltransferase [Streptosporangiaceae bacterium]|jgi:glucose-1-phosphate thymidylyltransferase|nr:glucose-1-phosphate thymidylyltransferase [Streptosporangiaceae bacterium]
MKALILSGGVGTRLRPVTYSMPKQLVPVANKPVIRYGLESIIGAGITDVGIVVGGWADTIEAQLGDGSALGARITYLHQDAPRGLAHCVMIARDFLGDEDFIMYLGDNVLLGGLDDIVEGFAATRPAAQVVVTKVSDPSGFGVAELGDEGVVLSLEEKPARPRSDLGLMGIYLFTPVVHEAVRAIRPSHRNEWEITDALQWLVQGGYDVRAHVYSSYWRDTGRIDDLLECNRAVLDMITRSVDGDVDSSSEVIGPVVLERGARVSRSRLIGPCLIGAGTVIERSTVGPYASIDRDCEVTDAQVQDSIVMSSTVIRGVGALHGSLVGRSARVEAGAGLRMTVGDECVLEVPR